MTTTKLRFLIAGALVGGALVTGCAQAQPEGTVSPNPSPSSSSPSGVPTFTPSTEVTKPSASEVTLTGTVERVGIEGGCTVLRVDTNKSFELKGGDPAIIKAGARVTIKGKIRTDLMTICQMGPVLEVISSQPA